MELPLFAIPQRTPRVVVTVAFVIFLLTLLVPALYSLLADPILPLSISSPGTDDDSSLVTRSTDEEQRCDLFTGEWVPNEEAPYYTNTTCSAIHDHQNCMRHGRPDTEFLKWKWKPDGCELPIFDPREFLERVRGKAMGFVGDSISRNQVQSLHCLLYKVEYPQDISSSSDTSFRVWNFTSYNFTLHMMWSPFLVKSGPIPIKPDSSSPFSLFLDEYDTSWTSEIHHLDFLVISSAHWFHREVIFYENKQISGCQYCTLPNTIQLPFDYGYRKALRLSLRAILENFKGLAILRGFSPPHYEGGQWNTGGDCVRTRPYRRNETIPADLKVHDIQLEEFRAAEEEGRRKKKKGLRLRLMDTTQAMLLRPDGHPGRYGHPQNAEHVVNDCIHWCLPGPIDTWNDILLQMIKNE